MKYVLYICALIALISIVGCRQGETYTDENGITHVSGSTSRKQVQIITIEGGTRCAIFMGYKKGGLSCDWGNRYEP